MMRARIMVENPDEIEMTLKLTMSIKDWCQLRDDLSKAYPAWKLSHAITEMLSRARKVFHTPDVDAFNAEYIP
jgi:hypothetical protein